MNLTDLEAEALRRILAGLDPWGGYAAGGSRRMSQTIGRLTRKGALSHEREGKRDSLRVTVAGRDALALLGGHS